MDGISNTPDRIEVVRQETIGLLENLVEKARAFELPEPPAALEQYRLKLVENTYNVLVVGEAKRGKSSFVNALIGCPILPTDVDIATSQVFRIAQGEHETYRIRFEDGSQQAIHAADLPRYGSQVVADVEGTPRLDQLIRWIEVDVPIRFLPRGVSMLDTPGLGSLYAAHAQITQRFVPHADAVIFVLDSGQPIIQPELEFVERILGVTRNIFFIQTKIDQHDQNHWQNIQRRNQAILAEQFKGRLADVRVWPVFQPPSSYGRPNGRRRLPADQRPEGTGSCLAGVSVPCGGVEPVGRSRVGGRALLRHFLENIGGSASQL